MTRHTDVRRVVLSILALVAGCLGTFGLSVTFAPSASACSCMAGSIAQELASSDAVFAGELVGRNGTAEDAVSYTFAVSRVYDGELTESTEVRSAEAGAACGLERMELGTSYLVFAYAGPEGLATTQCSGTRPLAEVRLDQLERHAGSGSAPTVPATADDSPPIPTEDRGPDSTIVALVAGVAAGLIVAGLIAGAHRRMRSPVDTDRRT